MGHKSDALVLLAPLLEEVDLTLPLKGGRASVELTKALPLALGVLFLGDQLKLCSCPNDCHIRLLLWIMLKRVLTPRLVTQ